MFVTGTFVPSLTLGNVTALDLYIVPMTFNINFIYLIDLAQLTVTIYFLIYW